MARATRKRPQQQAKRTIVVDPEVMAAAIAARRWGERLVVVNSTTVRLVPDR